MTPELTQEMIDEGMARADKVACSPGDQRCYPFRWGLKTGEGRLRKTKG